MTARYEGIEVREFDDVEPGTYALIKHWDENTGGEEWYTLDVDYPRTNRSGQPRRRGWCGSTNGHSVHACGCVEVYLDARGQKRIREADDDALDVDVSSDGAEVGHD